MTEVAMLPDERPYRNLDALGALVKVSWAAVASGEKDPIAVFKNVDHFKSWIVKFFPDQDQADYTAKMDEIIEKKGFNFKTQIQILKAFDNLCFDKLRQSCKSATFITNVTAPGREAFINRSALAAARVPLKQDTIMFGRKGALTMMFERLNDVIEIDQAIEHNNRASIVNNVEDSLFTRIMLGNSEKIVNPGNLPDYFFQRAPHS